MFLQMYGLRITAPAQSIAKISIREEAWGQGRIRGKDNCNIYIFFFVENQSSGPSKSDLVFT